ncbi:MAG: ABC transporter permease [Hyphomonadaceae bacterium]
MRTHNPAAFNFWGVRAIYQFEMARWVRTLGQSLFSPVLSTSLYFIVFGAAIGSRMGELERELGVNYGAFIVPGLIMLSLLTESVSNASFGIYMPKWAGTIYELLSAPVSAFEAVLGYVGAAATKSLIIGIVILITARFFVAYEVEHPLMMMLFLVLTSVSFCLFGFILGVWADGFEKLQIVPMLILTPLTFLGGTFYSIRMLPEFWQQATLFNPIVYLISGFRWSFFGEPADVPILISLGATCGFLAVCMAIVWWIFRTGYRLKT